MVGPRGGSPYAVRTGGRVSKQQYFQQALAAQQQQAAAAAASYNQQQQQQQQQQQAVAAVAAVEKIKKSSSRSSGPQAEENKDVISLRETATVRYIRYREWMELVIGTATETPKYVPPSTNVARLTISSEPAEPVLSEKGTFYKKAAETLRNDFLDKQGAETLEKKPHSTEAELREKFGLEVSNQVKVKRIAIDLGLPQPARAPSKEVLEAQLAKYEQAKTNAFVEQTVSGVSDHVNDAEMADAAAAVSAEVEAEQKAQAEAQAQALAQTQAQV